MTLQLGGRGLLAVKRELGVTLTATADYGVVAAELQARWPSEAWPSMWEPCRAADVLSCPELLLPLAALQTSEDDADHARLSATVLDPLRGAEGGRPMQVRVRVSERSCHVCFVGSSVQQRHSKRKSIANLVSDAAT